MQLEEAAEGRRTHTRNVSQRVQADFVHIVLGDIVLHFQHTARVALHLDLGIARSSQRAGTLATRQLVEDGQELHHSIEAVLHTAERVELLIDAHDGIHGERQALAGFIQHFPQAVEGVPREESVVAQVQIELNGNLADVVAGTGILFPDVLQIGTGDEHEVVVANDLVRVANDTPHTGSVLNEIELEHLVVVDGIGELLLPAVGNIEGVLTHQRGDFVYDSRLFHSLNSQLNLQFLQNLTHALHVIDTHRHQGQTQHILDIAHLAEHRLHTSGIAVDEEQREEVDEAVVNLAGSIVLATHLQANHLRELLGQGITDDADDTYCSARHHRERQRVVAADDVEGARLVLDDFVDLLQITRRLLDGHDVLAVGSQAHRRRCRHIDARTTGNVIEHYRQFRGVGNGLEMLVESFLRRFVVIGTYAQYAVDTLKITSLQLFDNGRCVVTSTSHQDGHTPANQTDYQFLDALFLVGSQCGCLTRCRQNAEEISSVVELIFDQSDERLVIH